MRDGTQSRTFFFETVSILMRNFIPSKVNVKEIIEVINQYNSKFTTEKPMEWHDALLAAGAQKIVIGERRAKPYCKYMKT